MSVTGFVDVCVSYAIDGWYIDTHIQFNGISEFLL